MEYNVIFDNATIYNFQSLEVRKGESFKIQVKEMPDNVKWFSDNDPVVDILDNGNEAQFLAKSEGKSTIIFVQYINGLPKILGSIPITVVEGVLLNIEVSSIEEK